MTLPRLLTLALLLTPTGVGAAEVDYGRDVKPVLAKYCVSCHGPDKQRGGLRLDTAAAARAGGDGGAGLVAGKGSASRLVQALAGTDDLPRMPPKDPRPSEKEAALLAAWIDAGAKAPQGEVAAQPAKAHWAFQPVARPVPPAVKATAWVRNPIDNFVLAKLEAAGLAPSPEADKPTLIRRVTLDLTGLLPTPEEAAAFAADADPRAYDRLVERLLASPHYGERWGRHWLDQARYADSNGYSIDGPRSIWPYRDWVIDALNADLPFDRFTVEQLAGDLLPGASAAQQVATGFHRNTQVNQEGGVDPEQFRVEAVVDRTNTTGAVWLGLTVGCAQCHTHKYDPLTHAEYYQLFAFFNAQDDTTLTLKPGGKAKGDPPAITTLVLKERATARATKVLAGGDFTRPTTPVSAGTPAALPALPKAAAPTRLDLARWLVAPENPLTPRVQVNRVWGQLFGTGLVETDNDFGTQGERPTHPELLDWLADEFRSADGCKWSLKKLHTRLVTSASYRQSSNHRADLAAADPRNRLLGRQSRLRLEAEAVRDVGLCASGLLNPRVGGPGVFPPQPEGANRVTQVARAWTPSRGPDRYRRGMYTYFWRAAPHPALAAFDAPDAGTTCTRRARSNTPLQALTLLNDAAFYEFAHGLAGRALAAGPDPAARIRAAAAACLGRTLSALEAARLAELYRSQRDDFAAHPDAAAALLAGGGPAGEALSAAPGPAADKAALVVVARTLLNLDEFITRE